MPRRLPPLTALRAFEAAARLLSFTRAADELHVTQAAVSHQVKALEDHLGTALFRRVHRGLLLTDAGQTLLPHMTEALDIISAAVESLNRRRRTHQINITTLDSLTASWLMPRLVRFRMNHPGIDINISTYDGLTDLQAEGFDLGIRYGDGAWRRVDARPLMTEEIFPVCAPKLLENSPALKAPSDLRRFTLLHDEGTEGWKAWLNAAGVNDIDVAHGLTFTHSNLVFQAAREGAGIALGRSVLVQDDLDAGRLARPLAFATPARRAYWMVTPKGVETRKDVRTLMDWLAAEAG
ncbi:MAG: transcriptional regulator GcvA [Rhodospirillales bacterium]